MRDHLEAPDNFPDRGGRDAGWLVNAKRVERIWRREGLKVPPRQPKRGRLWLADGSCIRMAVSTNIGFFRTLRATSGRSGLG
jgi:hypothetical protein